MVCTAADLRGLAEDSLTLLKEFLYDERFPALFDLEVYGSIIGMFELNNLSMLLTCCHCLSAALACVWQIICSFLTCILMHCLHKIGKWLAR